MSSGNVFLDCVREVPDAATNSTILLQCISDAYQEQQRESFVNTHAFMMVICGGMIFFMQTGFAMLCAGSVRLKNVQNTMLKNLLDACGAAIAWFLIGFAFAFGGDDEESSFSTKTFLGTEDFASVGSNSALWFFQYTFSATSVTIVAGTLAERCQMVAYLCYSVVVAGFIYPVIAHTIWSHSGYLSGTNDDPFMGSGAIDFAGSGVVHMTGGTIALVATIILGPRRGRFYDAQGEPLDTPKVFPGHSVALQMLGTMVLWFGWFGFNSGSSLLLIKNQNYGFVASNAAVSTALSGATGGITALFTNVWAEQRRTGEPKFVIGMAMNGALSGLVASTSGCALVTPGMAIITGLIAGWLYMWASSFLLRVKIDDAVDAIPVHMFSGAWGMIATGLFAHPDRLELTYGSFDNPGVFYSFGGERGANAVLLVNQICAVLFIAAWCIFTMLPFFVFLNYMGWLRADSLEELVGLDMSYHGATLNAANGGKSQEQVKKSYVDAYNRHKSALRKRKTETMESEDIENADTDASGTSHEKM